MPKSFSNSMQLDQLSKIELAVRAGRDSHGRVLPGSKTVPTHYRPDTPCEGIKCSNIVKAGPVVGRQKRFFCSPACENSFHNHAHLIGDCEYCHEPFYGPKKRVGVTKHCSREHEQLHEADVLYLPTGCFRPLIEDYLAGTVRYKKGTLPTVKVSLIHFFSHIFTVEGVSKLNDITSKMVGRFGVAEQKRGITSGNCMGHMSTFFKCLMAEDEAFTARNPVIPYIHSQKSNPAVARPFAEDDLEFIWGLVKDSNNFMLMLAFAIGEECGLRIGETCNIRIEDVDQVKQTIFVRLPTKNGGERTVPYHDKVAKSLELWLQWRNPESNHDHLLHSLYLKRFVQGSLNPQWQKLFKDEKAPALGFKYHRLRHTWATRLMNNGMELAVLKELGGWKSWNSMQRYIRVLPDTVRRQYEEAYRKLQEKPEARVEVTLSLMDFAALAAPEGAAPLPKAA